MQKYYSCGCGVILKTKEGLERHKSIRHSVEGAETKCPECGKLFYSKNGASIHVRKSRCFSSLAKPQVVLEKESSPLLDEPVRRDKSLER